MPGIVKSIAWHIAKISTSIVPTKKKKNSFQPKINMNKANSKYSIDANRHTQFVFF